MGDYLPITCGGHVVPPRAAEPELFSKFNWSRSWWLI